MRVPMATSAASALVIGLPEKRCHNVYAEPHPNDPKSQIALVEAPGSLQRNTFAAACRGLAQADGHAGGKVLVFQGNTVSTYDPGADTVGTLTGTIDGTDTVDCAFTQTEAAILANGSIYVSDGTTVTLTADPDFPLAITSVASLGQRILFTYEGGKLGFTDVLDVDNIDALSYYTAEQSPDDLVAVRVVGEVAYLFGTETLEPWVQTGDSDDPFALQSGMVQQVGCACRDGIVEADNTLFFVDEAFNVCRMGAGQSPVISEPWVSDLLKAAGAANIRGMYYSDKGHAFVMWRTPNGCVAYDILMERWHTRGTNLTASWRYTSMVMTGASTSSARVFVADDEGQFDELSRDYTTESMPDEDTAGTEIVREFTAYLPTQSGRMAIKTVKIECAKGIGIATGQGENPLIEMRQSKNAGNTWTSWRSRGIGRQGEYGRRTIWRRRGRAKDQGIVFHFRKSDPVKCAYLGVIVNEDVAA